VDFAWCLIIPLRRCVIGISTILLYSLLLYIPFYRKSTSRVKPPGRVRSCHPLSNPGTVAFRLQNDRYAVDRLQTPHPSPPPAASFPAYISPTAQAAGKSHLLLVRCHSPCHPALQISPARRCLALGSPL
jgi:hypothetical protein